MKNNFDISKGTGKQFQLFGEDVYSLTPDMYGNFTKEGRVIAKRVRLPLQQDSVYKTSFFNEELKNAIEPLNEDTKIILYDEDGKEINQFLNLPSFKREYSSIVFEVEPEKPVAEISIVIYTGPKKENVFLNDGSVTMEDGYVPIKPTDVVTKGYADDLLEDFTSLNYPLKSFEIYQNEKELPMGYSYATNEKLEVIYVRYLKGKKAPECKLRVNPFAIPNNFSNKIDISIKVGNVSLFKENIKTILDGESKKWKCVNMENIYTAEVSTLFWKNTYELTFDPMDLEIVLDEKNPKINVSVFLSEKGESFFSEEKEYGLDFYVDSAEGDPEIIYKEEDLQKERTKYLSGNTYFQPDYEKEYELPLAINLKNNFLNYYRPENFCGIRIKSKNEEIKDFVKWGSESHKPIDKEFTFYFDKILKYDLNIQSFIMDAYNLSGELLFSKEVKLDVETDESLELYRVKTCSSEFKFPATGYGDPWVSEEKVKEWDPIMKKGHYVSENENSAICFKITPVDCFSHAKINIKHDGIMFVKVEGKTGWLNSTKILEPFSTPSVDDDPCFVNENHFSFGKVIYNTPIFIRILGATDIEFISVTLE